MPPLTPAQREIVEAPPDSRIFLRGIAGAGKTTTGAARLEELLYTGAEAGSVLIFTPQRTLAAPYYEAFPRSVSGGLVTILTLGGLARRMVDLFWSLAADAAGFANPQQPPVFLTLETAQYYMARLVRPLLDEGYFQSVTIERNRLYSQIIDNLNKAAVVGFPHTQIGERLQAAWTAEPGQLRVYADAQECAIRFRQYCLQNNLLDFSLQVEVFFQHLWREPLCRNYLVDTYRHLIYDNIEEDSPAAHGLISEWLLEFDSALLIYDNDGGYRRFLGADPQTGLALSDQCSLHAEWNESFSAPPEMQAFGQALAAAVDRSIPPPPAEALTGVRNAYTFSGADFDTRFYPEMLDGVAEDTASLVAAGTPPGEIAILVPFLPDSLRYALAERLEQHGIPTRSHRPSRALRAEPATRCLLTLARLAHPAWKLPPSRYDVTYALMQAIQGLDLVRAHLLTEITYRIREGAGQFSSFEQIRTETQQRITYRLGERFEILRAWLAAAASAEPAALDIFLSRLFGEVLSQPGFGFHRSRTAGEAAARLVESARKFRWSVGALPPHGEKPLAVEFIEMVEDGVISAQYLVSWQMQPADSVLIAPAYTFLMANRAVTYQFWLDVGSRGWFERLYQPLTQPYVLSAGWESGRQWTDLDEVEANQSTLSRLVLGLTRRCRSKVYLALSELGEQGYEQKGPLLKGLQRALQRLPEESDV